jgi:hypothetical protein
MRTQQYLAIATALLLTFWCSATPKSPTTGRPLTLDPVTKSIAVLYPVETTFEAVNVAETFYGLTVHVALPQCLPALDRFVMFGPLASQTNLYTQSTSICAFFFSRPGNGTYYRNVGRKLHYRPLVVDLGFTRAQVTFAWTLWMDALQYPIVDVESRHVFVRLDPIRTMPKTWAEAESFCPGIHPAMHPTLPHLPTIITDHEHKITMAFAVVNGSASLQQAPIYFQRGGGTFQWTTGEDIGIQQWIVGRPDNSNGAEYYAGLRFTDNGWNDYDATTKFDTVICEIDKYRVGHTEQVSYYTDPNVALPSQTYTIKPAIPYSSLPITDPVVLATTIYGATFMTALTACTPSDTWWISQNHDYITYLNSAEPENNCRMYLGGEETVSTYNQHALNIWWNTKHTERPTLFQGYVYWLSRTMRYAAAHLRGRRSFYVVPGRTIHTNPSFVRAGKDTCVLTDFALAEPNVLDASGEIVETLRKNYGSWQTAITAKWLMGITWNSARSSWWWPVDNRAITVEDWTCSRPTGSKPCSAINAQGRWDDLDCSSTAGEVQGVVCSSQNYQLVNYIENNVRFASTALPQTTRRQAPGAILTAADLALFPDRYTAFGFSFQLSVMQCRPGDSISVSIAAAYLGSRIYNTDVCALTVKFVAAGVVMLTTKSILLTASFSYTDYSRFQFHIGWYIFTDVRLQGADQVLMDVETRYVYAWIPQQTVAMSWETSCRVCTTTFGAPFELASVTSTTVERLMSYSRTPFLESPLRGRRINDVGGNEFQWVVNGDNVTIVTNKDRTLYVNRMPDGGPGAFGDICLANRAGGIGVDSSWRAVNCEPGSGNTPNFLVAFCRYPDRPYFSGSVSLNGDNAVFSRPFSGVPFPLPGMLPESLSTEEIYGATISVSKRDSADASACLSTSTWYLPTTSHDHIGVLRFEPCAVFFAGRATIGEYTTLLRGLEFRTTRPFPVTHWFGYVYWSQRYLRELLMAPQTNRVYSYFSANTYWTPPSGYFYRAARQYCADYAMDVYEVHSEPENADTLALRANPHDRSDFYIGINPNAAGRWWTGWLIDYSNFINRNNPGVLITGKECAVMTSWGAWRSVACTTWIRGGVGCRSTGQFYDLGGTRQVIFQSTGTVTYPILESTRTLTYNSGGVPSIFVASDLNWIAATQTIFGATAQLSPRQCSSTDVVTFDSGWPYMYWYYRYELVPTACAMLMRDVTYQTMLVQQLRDYLPRIVMTTSELTRKQLTFALTLWLDARLLNMFTDVDTQHAYMRLDPAYTGTWQSAADRCASELGTAWTLLSPNTEPEAKFLSATLQTPILLVRNSSGAFVWGRPEPFIYSALQDTTDGTKECASATSQTSWSNAPCLTAYATAAQVICEAVSWNATAYVWLSLPEAAQATAYRQYIPLDFIADPAPPTTIYGVTIQVARRECYPNDRFVFESGFNPLQLQYSDPCTLMLSGTATISQYRYALKNVLHRSSEYRDFISFRSVYWLQQGLDRILYSFASNTNKVFAVINAQTTFTPTSSYPFYGARYLCGTFGGRLAEPISAAYNDDIQAVAKPTTNYLGAARVSPTGTSYLWLSGTNAWSYTPYMFGALGGEPVTPRMCMAITPSGRWRSAECTTPLLDGAVCEFTSWTLIDKTSIRFMPDRTPPPTTNRTRDRILTYDGTGAATIFDSSDLATFNDGTQAYGATVQLNPQQFLAGDKFTWVIGGGTSIGAYTPAPPYSTSQCTVCFYTGLKTKLTQDFKTVLATVKFQPVQQSRTQLQFSYIVWLTDKSVVSTTYPSMMFDAETRHAYSWFQLPATQRWAETLSTCRNLGPHWDLPTVNTAAENTILRTWQGAGSAAVFPLRATRTGLGEMMWENGDRITFADWNVESVAMQDPLTACLAMTGSSQPASARGHQWDAVACNASIFNMVVCETSEWTTFGVVSYLGAKNFNPSGIVLRSLVPSATLAATGTTREVYGMTVQTHRADCRSTDGYLSTANDAYVFVAYSDPCSIMFGGTGSVGDYIRFVDGVLWTTVYSNRTSIRFGAVLWVTPYVTRLVVDFSRNAVFFLNVAESQYTPTLSFLPNSSGLCAWNGMQLAQLNSSDAADAFEALVRTKDATFGLQRRWVGPTFDFFHSPSDQRLGSGSARWLKGEPRDGSDCVSLATWNVWTSASCAAAMPSTGCEARTWPVPLIFRQLALPVETVDRRRDRFRTFSYGVEGAAAVVLRPFVNVSQTDLQWLDPTAVLYGLTVQLAVEQCVTGDAFGLDRVVLPDLTYVLTAVPNVCASKLRRGTAAYAASVYFPALNSVTFTPATISRHRIQLSFAYVLWTNEQVLNMLTDGGTGAVYTTSQSEASATVVPRTWDEAWAYCKQLGPVWALPAPRSVGTSKLIHALLTNTGADVAVAIRRTPSNTMVWTDMSSMNYAPWSPTDPGPAATENCTLSSTIALGQLNDLRTIPCTASVFQETLCEAAAWQGSGVIAYTVSNPANVSVRFYPLLTAASLPTRSQLNVYGATIQVKASDCRVSDRPYFTASWDGVLVPWNSPCAVMLLGRATIDVYVALLASAGLATLPTSRSAVTAAFVLWTNASLQYAMLAADLPGTRFVTIPVMSRVGGSAVLNRLSYSAACAEAGPLIPAEPTSRARVNAMLDAAFLAAGQVDLGGAMIGLTRRSAVPDIVFVGATSATAPPDGSFEWAPQHPTAVAGEDCAVMLISGLIRTSPCTGAAVDLPVAMCGYESAGYTDSAFRGGISTATATRRNAAQVSAIEGALAPESAATPGVNLTTSPRVLLISARQNSTVTFTPFQDDPRLTLANGTFAAGSDTVHGVTIFVPQQLCDSLPYNRSDAPPMLRLSIPSLSSYIASATLLRRLISPCWLAVRGTATVAVYAQVLRTVTVTLDFASHPAAQLFDGAIPSAFTVSYAFWPRVTNTHFAVDGETGKGYAWLSGRPVPLMSPFSAVAGAAQPTKEAAFGACQVLLGAGLSSLPVIGAASEDRVLRHSAPEAAAGDRRHARPPPRDRDRPVQVAGRIARQLRRLLVDCRADRNRHDGRHERVRAVAGIHDNIRDHDDRSLVGHHQPVGCLLRDGKPSLSNRRGRAARSPRQRHRAGRSHRAHPQHDVVGRRRGRRVQRRLGA